MSFRVFLHSTAAVDVKEARAWYETQRLGLGDEFVGAVEEGLVALETRAGLSPVYYRGLRRVFLRRFPYKLFYLLEGDQVDVLRVLHGHRDHRRWLRGRLS